MTELHVRPHCPQLFVSPAVFVSQPLAACRSQSEKPGEHEPVVHVVPRHVGVPFGVEQMLPHEPQAAGLFVSVVSHPSPVSLLQLP